MNIFINKIKILQRTFLSIKSGFYKEHFLSIKIRILKRKVFYQ